MGNICRSPILMAILRKKAEERNIPLRVDSCALTTWYLGQPIDPRMAKAAEGLDLTFDQRARLITEKDFSAFDLILGVDREVVSMLKLLAKEFHYKGTIALATAYSKRFKDQDIHDPYYGQAEQFKKTVVMAEDCCEGILNSLKNL